MHWHAIFRHGSKTCNRNENEISSIIGVYIILKCQDRYISWPLRSTIIFVEHSVLLLLHPACLLWPIYNTALKINLIRTNPHWHIKWSAVSSWGRAAQELACWCSYTDYRGKERITLAGKFDLINVGMACKTLFVLSEYFWNANALDNMAWIKAPQSHRRFSE